MNNAIRRHNFIFSKRLQEVVRQALMPDGWSGGLLPDRLFLALLDDKESYGALIIRNLMKDWELARVRERVIAAILSPPGPRGTVRIGGHAALCDYLADRLRPIYGEDLPPELNTGHVLLALLCDRRLFASRYVALYWVKPIDVFRYLVRLPAEEECMPRFSGSS